jgi:hypothetical protein
MCGVNVGGRLCDADRPLLGPPGARGWVKELKRGAGLIMRLRGLALTSSLALVGLLCGATCAQAYIYWTDENGRGGAGGGAIGRGDLDGRKVDTTLIKAWSCRLARRSRGRWQTHLLARRHYCRFLDRSRQP